MTLFRAEKCFSTFFNQNISNELTVLGHEIDYKKSIGEANCIMYYKKDNIYVGVSDDRRNGSAKGY